MKEARQKGYLNMPLTQGQALGLRLRKEPGVERGHVVPEVITDRDLKRLRFQIGGGKRR